MHRRHHVVVGAHRPFYYMLCPLPELPILKSRVYERSDGWRHFLEIFTRDCLFFNAHESCNCMNRLVSKQALKRLKFRRGPLGQTGFLPAKNAEETQKLEELTDDKGFFYFSFIHRCGYTYCIIKATCACVRVECAVASSWTVYMTVTS